MKKEAKKMENDVKAEFQQSCLLIKFFILFFFSVHRNNVVYMQRWENGTQKLEDASLSENEEANEIIWNSLLATVAGDILVNQMEKVKYQLVEDVKVKMWWRMKLDTLLDFGM